jgi:ligand-binding sensor domain-containing protein
MNLRIALYLLIFCCFDSIGQNFTTINYSIGEGLPSSEVYEVFQDSKGFLWFGTDNGVLKFDGFELEKFSIENGLTDPVVFGFFEDAKGRIWFRTFSTRLCYYHDGKISVYPYNEALNKVQAQADIQFIYDAVKEELWFTLADFFGKIDSAGVVSVERFKPRGIHIKWLNGKPLPGMYFRVDNTIQAVTIRGQVFEIADNDTETSHRQVRLLELDNKLYFNVKKEIYEFDGKALKKVFTGRGVIISLSKDNHGNIWVGYMHQGVQRFTGADFSKEWTPQFLEKKSVTKVVEDPEQGLWFSTLESGVFYVPNLEIKNTVLETEAKIRAVLPCGDTFIAGDEAGFLYMFDVQKNKLVKKKFLGSSALTAFADKHNKLWIASVGNIHIFDTQLNELNHTVHFSANDFFEDDKGKVWSYGGHSVRNFDENGDPDFIRYLNQRYRSIYVDDSIIYLGGRIGLDLYDRSINLKDSPKFFANLKIADILPITDSTLLMASLGSGIIILNKRTLHARQYSAKDKFIADNIYAVQKTGNTIWLATEKGLARTDVASLHNENPSFEYLNKKSGLISDKINHLILKADKLLAFSDEGFSSIPRPSQRFANKTPGFYIKKVEVNQSLRKIADLSSLRHNENNIRIEFGYKSFNNPNIFTRYRLGDENSWTHTTNKNIQLIALAPGTYSFQLEHSVDNVHWAEASSFPLITVFPPWWQTWSFMILAGLLVSALIYFYLRHQVSIYR